MKFSNIHPASECDFLSGIFSGESIVMQISFVVLIFLLLSNQFFLEEGQIPGANCLMGQNTEMSCFQRKP